MLRILISGAVRNALRDRGYAFLSLVGLASGLACGMLVLLYLRQELSYNSHHSKAVRTYKVFESRRQQNGETSYVYSAPGAAASALVQDYPEVEDATRFMRRRVYVKEQDSDEGILGTVIVADARFFQVFDFPLSEGDPESGPAAPFSLLVTRKFAAKLFGDGRAIGRSVTLTGKLFDDTYTITGILDDVPRASTPDLSPDLITATRPQKDPGWVRDIWEGWRGTIAQTFIVLRTGASPSALQQKLPGFADRYMGGDQRPWTGVGFEMMPLTQLHLHGRQRHGLGYFGDVSTCYTLAGIGVLIVIAACINFMSLATARSVRRMQEVGTRKALGANRGQLIALFLGECGLLAALAVILALGLVGLALPTFNALLVTDLSLSLETVPILLGVALSMGLLAAAPPAMVLSSFSPCDALGTSHTTHISNGGTVRRGLVVVQSAVSMVLIVSTIVVLGQTEFLRTADPGFNEEALLVTRHFINRNAFSMKTQLQQVAGVHGVALSNSPVLHKGSWGGGPITVKPDRSNAEAQAMLLVTDADFVGLYQIPLLAGRPFTASDVISIPRGRGPSGYFSVVLVNETGADRLGIQVGDDLEFWQRSYRVVGIYQDFSYRSMHEAIGPLVLYPAIMEQQAFVSLRVDMARLQETLAGIRAAWNEIEPNQPFEFTFMDDVREASCITEARLAGLCSASAALAIGISVLGLFSLVSYTVERRTREVAIRKVLGATESSVVGLLTKEPLVLATLSSLIAFPSTYHATTLWLESFSYRISVGPIPYIVGGATVLVITLLAIGWQTVKAARANPVDALSSS